jgi:uncharacterized protein
MIACVLNHMIACCEGRTRMKKTVAPVLVAGFLTLLLHGCSSQPSTEAQSVGAPTPMMQAATDGNLSTVSSLVRKGESVNAVTGQGTALTKAAKAGHRDVVLALVRAGADPNLGVDEGQPSPLHHMTAAGELQGIRALIAAGANLDHRDEQGMTPLAIAAKNGNLPVARALIGGGANVNSVIQGRSLLMLVVERNSLLMAQVLIKAGADVNYRSSAGDTALQIAQGKNMADLVMLLVQSGARA